MNKMIRVLCMQALGNHSVAYWFWPSSAKFNTVVSSIRLVELVQNLTMEYSVSVKGSVEALRWQNRQTANVV